MATSFEYVEGWGMAVGAAGRVLRPRSVEELRACFARAAREGANVALRGTGNSYGDASVNDAGYVLDASGMDAILDFDRETGVITVEPGVTVQQLWKHILPLGYWPRVVSGTSFPTIAGAAAMNIHGKNNFAVGTIGDAIRELDIVLPSGELRTCSREENADLFHAAIGGFGMLGCFTRIVLETKRVFSGELEVRAFANRNLREMMEYIEAHRETSDYLVGWIDCFPGGDRLGRGQVHDARYLAPGEDPDPERTLTVEHQEVPSTVLGVFPKSQLWRVMRLFCNDPGMRFLNAVKVLTGRMEAMGAPRRWTHARFAFLLDFVPNWKWAYGRTDKRGLIQHQIFLPHAAALEGYRAILECNQRQGFLPYLGVFKRHRPDPFWLTHALDGWSLALDYKVTPSNREALWRHCAEITAIALDHGGKFYFAKDLVVGYQDMLRFFPPARLADFRALKREVDPGCLLQTNLWRRVFENPR
ncbi:MAG: FAD-binding oxidoreductase [Planctomycetota bacterium]|nr:FAD-binding oxidoreductase [Planctomycetota bacterium]